MTVFSGCSKRSHNSPSGVAAAHDATGKAAPSRHKNHDKVITPVSTTRLTLHIPSIGWRRLAVGGPITKPVTGSRLRKESQKGSGLAGVAPVFQAFSSAGHQKLPARCALVASFRHNPRTKTPRHSHSDSTPHVTWVVPLPRLVRRKKRAGGDR